MSQEQQEKPIDHLEAITNGDAFNIIQGGLATKPVAPEDASLMQVLEDTVLGGTHRGGIAAHLKAAASWNERAAGLVGHNDMNYVVSSSPEDASTRLPLDKVATRRDDEGISVTEMRNDPYLTTHPAGVSASIAEAARFNERM